MWVLLLITLFPLFTGNQSPTTSSSFTPKKMDPGNPRETWNRIQSALARAQQKGGGPRARAPKGFVGSAAGLLILGAAAATFNSAIFNGKLSWGQLGWGFRADSCDSRWWASRYQIYSSWRCEEGDLQ
jgi:hypothetical protein